MTTRAATPLVFLFGTAFFALGGPPTADAAPACIDQNTCAIAKPLLLFVVDYSTSMNAPFGVDGTRWDALVDALTDVVLADNGYAQSHFQLGLLRFGHDPDPGAPGTAIPGDASGLVDGQRLDLGFYDPLAPGKPWFDCNGDAFVQTLAAIPPPLGGQQGGIESWTRGALERARDVLVETAADHPEDLGKRRAAIVLVTDGPWTDPTGTMELAPLAADPAPVAAELLADLDVATHVVTLGEALGQLFAHELSFAGGTGLAVAGVSPTALPGAIATARAEVVATDLATTCSARAPRVMVLLDASSSMLNIMGNSHWGGPGQTGWDQARDALAGQVSLFDHLVDDRRVEAFAHLGLAVFGHDAPAPGEQKLVVDYGPCRKDSFSWALDPSTSCALPGCDDPWGGPPITWTFQSDGVATSHAPRCDFFMASPDICTGSGSYLHLGLQTVAANLADYKAACPAPDFPTPCDDDTAFVNIVITDYLYNSTDAQVKGQLEQLYLAGITTHVIGFGDQVGVPNFIAQLNNMASWGSGGALTPATAQNQMQLELALAAIADQLPYDPCCDAWACQEAPGYCGDGELDDLNEEECDDGNDLNGDGCSVSCEVEPWSTTTDTTTTDSSTADGSTTDDSTTTTTGATTEAVTTAPSSTTVDTTGATTSTSTTDPSPTSGLPSPTTGPSPTTTAPDPVEPATTSAATSSPESATSDSPTSDAGCACAAGTREVPAPPLLLALAALPRRRRART